MKKITSIEIAAVLLASAVNVNAKTLPANYLPDFHTPHSDLALESDTFAQPGAYKTAKVYWLPDYQSATPDSINIAEAETETPPLPAPVVNCTTLGFGLPSYVKDMTKYTYTSFLAANKLRCYKNFKCKSTYNKTECPEHFKLDGASCSDSSGTYYEKCSLKTCDEDAGVCMSDEECKNATCVKLPCAGYYDCGGSWQYCEGNVCSTDSDKCSTFCKDDYFPYSCSSQEDCGGIYRNGWCSEDCTPKVRKGKIYAKFIATQCAKEAIPEGSFMAGRHRTYFELNLKCIDSNNNTIWSNHAWLVLGSLMHTFGASETSWCDQYKNDYGYSLETGYNYDIGREACSPKCSSFEDFKARYVNQYGLWGSDTSSTQYPNGIECDETDNTPLEYTFTYEDIEKY